MMVKSEFGLVMKLLLFEVRDPPKMVLLNKSRYISNFNYPRERMTTLGVYQIL